MEEVGAEVSRVAKDLGVLGRGQGSRRTWRGLAETFSFFSPRRLFPQVPSAAPSRNWDKSGTGGKSKRDAPRLLESQAGGGIEGADGLVLERVEPVLGLPALVQSLGAESD